MTDNFDNVLSVTSNSLEPTDARAALVYTLEILFFRHNVAVFANKLARGEQTLVACILRRGEAAGVSIGITWGDVALGFSSSNTNCKRCRGRPRSLGWLRQLGRVESAKDEHGNCSICVFPF